MESSHNRVFSENQEIFPQKALIISHPWKMFLAHKKMFTVEKLTKRFDATCMLNWGQKSALYSYHAFIAHFIFSICVSLMCIVMCHLMSIVSASQMLSLSSLLLMGCEIDKCAICSSDVIELGIIKQFTCAIITRRINQLMDVCRFTFTTKFETRAKIKVNCTSSSSASVGSECFIDMRHITSLNWGKRLVYESNDTEYYLRNEDWWWSFLWVSYSLHNLHFAHRLNGYCKQAREVHFFLINECRTAW